MTLKTPEQLADEATEATRLRREIGTRKHPLDYADIRAAVVVAIRQDREQHIDTLGDVAEVLGRVQASGVTLGALRYAITQVYWAELDEEAKHAKKLAALMATDDHPETE